MKKNILIHDLETFFNKHAAKERRNMALDMKKVKALFGILYQILSNLCDNNCSWMRHSSAFTKHFSFLCKSTLILLLQSIKSPPKATNRMEWSLLL